MAIQWEGNVASTGEKMKIATFFPKLKRPDL